MLTTKDDSDWKKSESGPATKLFSSNERCEKVLSVFSLFSNRYRFKILCLLTEGDFCVSEIAETVGGKHSNISQQLKMLTLAGYLTKRRENKSIYYHLEDVSIKKLLRFLHAEYGGEAGS